MARKGFTMVPHYIVNSDVTGDALKLYCMIVQLSSKDGFCWASNEYFATRMNTSAKSIQRYVKELKDLEFITVKMYSHTGKTSRHIFPSKPKMAVDINVHG